MLLCKLLSYIKICNTKIHKEGIQLISFSILVSLGLSMFAQLHFTWLIVLFLIWFFRDPKRILPDIKDTDIISPADGQVIKIIHDATPPAMYEDVEQKWCQISIFMRVYDVHINRFPTSGIVARKIYTAGKFSYAAAAQADTDNERLSILITNNKFNIIAQQVAGMAARRIVCNAKVDDVAHAGSQYGIIKIGSRLDLFIPNHFNVNVKVGDIVKAGLTFISTNNN